MCSAPSIGRLQYQTTQFACCDRKYASHLLLVASICFPLFHLQTRPGRGWWVLRLTFQPATRAPAPARCWWTALCATRSPPTTRTWRAPVYGFMSRRTTWTWTYPAQPWRVLRSLWRSRFSRRFLCKVCRFCCRCCRSCWYIPVPAKRGLLMSKNAAGMVVGRVVASWHTLFFFFLP